MQQAEHAVVRTQAVVGEIADDTAVLTSESLELFRMPLALLPHPLSVGMVVDLHAALNPAARAEREESVREVQRALCARLQLPPPGPAEQEEQVAVPFSHALPPLPSGALLEVSTLPPASSCADVVLGGRVWKAAPALCAWMASAAPLFVGRSVLELGAGTGACGTRPLLGLGLGVASPSPRPGPRPRPRPRPTPRPHPHPHLSPSPSPGACGLYAAALGAARVVLTEGGDEARPRCLNPKPKPKPKPNPNP